MTRFSSNSNQMKASVLQVTIRSLSLVSVLLSRSCTTEAMHSDFFILPDQCKPAGCRTKCQDLGYEDLAALSTPEAFTYALKMMEPFLSGGISVNIGLLFSRTTNRLEWVDGSLPAPDTPWDSNPPTVNKVKPFGRMRNLGKIEMLGGADRKMAICGNSSDVQHAQGKSFHGQQPDSWGSNLNVTKAVSYLKCVTLCGLHNWCRAAEFHSELQTCTIFAHGMYDGLVPNVATSTFIRLSYSLLQPLSGR
ncbi:hypothetical protein RRG08_006710 [Elysia crispata]|uniref:Uncharacterized protein n=1 Tax=Elysia crispata TaxID=231223 RepID=A0AAE1BE44_9GAST|nr:hypothetical protein RRG08_006710 [Elysia crispata]